MNEELLKYLTQLGLTDQEISVESSNVTKYK